MTDIEEEWTFSDCDCYTKCDYVQVTNGECECWNRKQDEQPGHPEHG